MDKREEEFFLKATERDERTSLDREIRFWSGVAERAGPEVAKVVSGIELVPRFQGKAPLKLALVELECGIIKPIFLTEAGERASSVDFFNFQGAFGEVQIGDYLVTGKRGRIEVENETRPLYAEYEMGLGLGELAPEIRIGKGDLRVEWRKRLGEARWGWGLEHFSKTRSFGCQVDEGGAVENMSLVPTRLEAYRPEKPEIEIGTGVSYQIEGETVSPPLITIFEIEKVLSSAREEIGGKEVVYTRYETRPLSQEAKAEILARERDSIVAQHKAAFSKMLPGYDFGQPLDVPQVVSDLLLKP